MKMYILRIILLISILMFIGVFIFLFRSDQSELPKEGVVPYYFDDLGYIYIQDDEYGKYIIDTGAETSILFKENVDVSSSFRRFNRINDKETAVVRRVDSLVIGDFVIKNHPFAFLSLKQTFHYPKEDLVGIIGMDILSQRYCFFNRNEQMIYLSESRTDTLSPALTVYYEDPLKPLLKLTINNKEIDNVLFDTGYNIFLALKHSDFIPGKKYRGKQEKTNTSFFNDKYEVLESRYDTLYINNIPFFGHRRRMIPIIFNEKLRILGNNFASSWRAFSIDPHERRLDFYK